jgi:hypothetical protein
MPFRAIALAIVPALLAAAAKAQIPHGSTVTYQGRLTDAGAYPPIVPRQEVAVTPSALFSAETPWSGIAGKTVALEPATGFSFDSPMSSRPR